jgi:probable selenium-dependent hydroxylase accessory protein YqeC
LAKHPKIEVIKGKGSAPAKTTSLKEAFDIHYGDVISLVGAGGKTTLMLALAKELAATGESIVTTTTTKIFDWQAPGSSLIVELDEKKMIAQLVQELKKHRHVTLASERLLAEGKLKGISPELVARLAELEQIAYIIIEADGAARRPLKAPNATEPVIPQNTSLVIPIVGIDALDSKLNKENVFRPEIVSRLTGLPLGSVISADAITTLMTHTEGIIKGSPPHARIIPLINRMDLAQGLATAENLASNILERGHPQIERVVLGQVQSAEPVVEIFQAAPS